MENNTTLNKLKEQAERNALKRLQANFATPEQLEQIEQHLIRDEKRKNMIENQLKSAIQSHFISVSSCMEQLKEVDEKIVNVKDSIYSIQDDYKTVSHLENTLAELRKEATKHKQLKAAKGNVQNILNVNDLAKKAFQHIEENKILLAHKCMFDIEKCRNEILEELGKPSDKNNNIDDIKLVEEFFKKSKEIKNLIHNYIFLTIKRMQEVAKAYPEQLVTALRIIEREEALDEYWLKKKEETGFAPPDRPRKWRQECKDTIKTSIETKILGCKIEEKETDSAWFSKHLGNICTRLVQDLELVRKLCIQCFPPSYKIFDFYVLTIHKILADYFKNLLDTNQLKEQEFFVLISWQDTYKSDFFMAHPNVKYDVSKLPDLLDQSNFNKALDGHLDYTMKKITYWFSNAMEKNYTEWLSNVTPLTIEGFYESSLPNDINTMLIQQLDLMNYANDERFSKETLKFIRNQLDNFVEMLRTKIDDFKANHFRNTDVLKNGFTIRMVATSNDCLRLKDYFLLIRNRYDKFIDKDEIGGPNDIYEKLGAAILDISKYCCECIIEDMYICLNENFFKILISKDWLSNDNIINTIVETSRDYMNDFMYLRPDARLTVLTKWHIRIRAEYMRGFLQHFSGVNRAVSKFKLNDIEERKLFGTKMAREIQMLERWFLNVSSNIMKANTFDFGALTLMNKIIKAEDVDFIGVEIGALVKKCPNLTSDMIYALIVLRGDISKSDYKEQYEDFVINAAPKQNSKAPVEPVLDEALELLKEDFKS